MEIVDLQDEKLLLIYMVDAHTMEEMHFLEKTVLT